MVVRPMCRPWFICCQLLVIWPLWLVYLVLGGSTVAGLDSIAPGSTNLMINDDCEDLRHQLWRWWTYQFTFAGFAHIFYCSFLLVFLGVPLEGFNGFGYMFFMFNVGVLGGACCFLFADPHEVPLVGMDGGCYSLLVTHLIDCARHFSRKERPRTTIGVLLTLLLLHVLITALSYDAAASSLPSHWSCFGGAIAGILVGVVAGRDAIEREHSKWTWKIAAAVGFILIVASLFLAMRWPPRDIFDNVPWCWARQVTNVTLFNDAEYHCVRCQDLDCVDYWNDVAYTMERINSLGCGWSPLSSR